MFHDKAAEMRLSEIGPIETVKAISAEDTSLEVQVVFLPAVDEESLPIPIHKLRLNHANQLFYIVKIVTTEAAMEVEIVNFDSLIIALV